MESNDDMNFRPNKEICCATHTYRRHQSRQDGQCSTAKHLTKPSERLKCTYRFNTQPLLWLPYLHGILTHRFCNTTYVPCSTQYIQTQTNAIERQFIFWLIVLNELIISNRLQENTYFCSHHFSNKGFLTIKYKLYFRNADNSTEYRPITKYIMDTQIHPLVKVPT